MSDVKRYTVFKYFDGVLKMGDGSKPIYCVEAADFEAVEAHLAEALETLAMALPCPRPWPTESVDSKLRIFRNIAIDRRNEHFAYDALRVALANLYRWTFTEATIGGAYTAARNAAGNAAREILEGTAVRSESPGPDAWIALAERRPTFNDVWPRTAAILAVTTHGSIREAYWQHVANLWDEAERTGERCYYTHWMPMPAPPGGVEQPEVRRDTKACECPEGEFRTTAGLGPICMERNGPMTWQLAAGYHCRLGLQTTERPK